MFVKQKVCYLQVKKSKLKLDLVISRMDVPHLWVTGSGETAAEREKPARRGRHREFSSAARGSAAPNTPWPGRGTHGYWPSSVLRRDKVYYNNALHAYYLTLKFMLFFLSKLCKIKMQINIKNFPLKIKFVYISAYTCYRNFKNSFPFYEAPHLEIKKKSEQGSGCYSGYKLQVFTQIQLNSPSDLINKNINL